MKKIAVMLGIIAFLSANIHDPTYRYRDEVDALMMVSSGSGDQVASALFNTTWYNVGDLLKDSEWKVVSIDSQNAVVVLNNGMIDKVVALWD